MGEHVGFRVKITIVNTPHEQKDPEHRLCLNSEYKHEGEEAGVD